MIKKEQVKSTMQRNQKLSTRMVYVGFTNPGASSARILTAEDRP